MFVLRCCVGESSTAAPDSASGGGGFPSGVVVVVTGVVEGDAGRRQGTNIGESMCIFMCLGKTIVKHLLLWGSFGRVPHFLRRASETLCFSSQDEQGNIAFHSI